jgi:REP element-mobilizing transposase RayT
VKLYKNKYRIESTRLKDWDYSIPWWYYITICTKNNRYHFGKIKNGKMILNKLGEMVEEEWTRTKTLRSQVDLDYYVVMPNHIHGIVIIEGSEHQIVVETHRDASLRTIKNNLSDIIRGFKGSVTKRIRSKGYLNFACQPRFYDHIIRNENDLYRIRTYIQNNPLKWELDEYYSRE